MTPTAARPTIAALAFSLLAALGSLDARAQTQLEFVPASLTFDVGDSQLVQIGITGIPSPGLSAFQIALTYDSAVVALTDPNAGFAGSVEPYAPLGGDPQCATIRGTPGCDDPDWLLTSTSRSAVSGLVDDTTPGTATVVFGTTGSAAAPTGDGALLMLNVAAVANGSTSVTLSAVAAAATNPPSAIAASLGSLSINVGPITDTDMDGIADGVDNCTLLANSDQRDSNGDGYGNLCDPDLNNDGVINAIDLGLFKTVFFTPDDDGDFDGNGIVNVLDLGILKTFFFLPPGPSGLAP